MGVGRVVGKGVGRGFKSKFWAKQVSLHWVWLSVCTLRDEIGRNRIFRGESPIFWGNPPCNDITFSKKRHNLTRKVRKRDVREISPNYLCKKKQPSWKSEKKAHFEFSNSNISILGQYFKPKIEIWTDFTVIWRWYKRLVTAFSSFWVKIGGWCGSSAHGSKISNNYCGVMDAFRGLKLIICRDTGLIWMSCRRQGCGFSYF